MRSERRPYTTTLYIWNGVSAVFFSSCVTPFHSHDTIQLMFDLRDRFKFRIQSKEWGSYKSLIIKENTIHQLDTNGSVQLIIYLDASCDAAIAIKQKYLRDDEICSPDLSVEQFSLAGELEQCLLDPNKELLLKVVHRLLKVLTGDLSPIKTDERVSTVLQLIAADPTNKLSIAYLADKIFLSESRLRSLFKKSMGVSLHRYIIWHKIRVASAKIMNGSTIIDAAEECGFNDTSHFHKMMVQMFGVSPSQFMKENNRVNIELCDSSPLRMETKQYGEKFWNVEKVIR
ncbi:MAG: helix-turn-helix domain-containing protein [Cyclobacteriaceae bacterium]